jgi:dihydroflavonol-4-reductase
MKILITGITGLLGSYLAKKFSSLGTVYGLKRNNSDSRLLGDFAQEVNWFEGDVTDYLSVEEAVTGMDLVIHAAGLVSFDPADKADLMKINVEGTAHIVNAMLEKGVKKIIHISSVSALGRSPGIKTMDESHKWSTSNLNSPYAISKYLGELEVWRGAQEGLDVLIFMPSVILGKISDQRSSTRIYDHVLSENKFYPTGSINYLDVRDAAETIYRLFQKNSWGNRFILNKESISYKEFFRKMADAFGKKAPTMKVNAGMFPVILSLLWVGKRLGLVKTLLNPQTAKLSRLKITMDNSKSQKLLNFSYTPLEDTFTWAKTNEKE